MKRSGFLATLILLVGLFSSLWCSAWGATDGYYSVAETTSSWDGTTSNTLMNPTADYDYTYGDEVSITYTLPWAVTFYGHSYSGFTADTNGSIWFTATTAANSFNLVTTGRGPVMAAWNNDLSSSFTGGVFIQHKTNPERVVIAWQTETYTDQGSYAPNTFEVVIFPDGRIRYDYNSFTTQNGADSGSGVSRGDGSASLNLTTLYGNAFTLAGRSFLFTPQSLNAVTVTKTGLGSGTAASSPPGISCGSTCSSNYAQGTILTLTATPDFGAVFDGWSGACSGTGPCTVTIDNAKSISASFSPTLSPMVAISSPSGVIATNTPTLTYVVSTGTVVVKVDGLVVNKVSGAQLYTLTEGTHVVRVEATNGTGHTGFAESSFTVDTTAPVATSITPATGSTNVPVRMSVLVRFAEPIDPASVTANSVSLTTQGISVPGSVTLAPDGTALIFTPQTKLAYASTYTVTLKAGLRDLAGNTQTGTVTTTFTTPLIDPDLVGYWPMDGDWNDYSGQVNNAMALGGAGFANGREPGVPAGNFVIDSQFYNGSAGYVETTEQYIAAAPNTFTMSFWAKPTATRVATAETTIGVSGTGGQRYAIAPINIYEFGVQGSSAGVSVGTNGISVFEDTGLYINVSSDGVTGFDVPSLLVYDTLTPLSGWNHIVVVFNNKQPSLYLNGEPVKTGLTSQQSVVYPSAVFADTSTGYGAYSGMLEGISLFKRALTAQEIHDLYHDQAKEIPVISVTSPGQTVKYRPGDTGSASVTATATIGINKLYCSASGSAREGILVANFASPQTSVTQQFSFNVIQDATPYAAIKLSCVAQTAEGIFGVGEVEIQAADIVPPTVTSSTPADNDTGISAVMPITVTFNESMNPASFIARDTLKLQRTDDGTFVTGMYAFSADSKKLFMLPSPAMAASTSYILTIGAVTDLAGNMLASPYVVHFTTLQQTSLTLDNQGSSAAPYVLAAGRYGTLALNNSYVSVSGGVTVDSLSLNSTTLNVSPSAVMPGNLSVTYGDMAVTGSSVSVNGTVNLSANLNVTNSTMSITDTSTVAGNIAMNNSTLTLKKAMQVTGAVTLQNQSVLTDFAATTTDTSKVDITAAVVNIDATSKIDVSGKGYLGGFQRGNDPFGYRYYTDCYGQSYVPATGENNVKTGRTNGNTANGGSSKGNGGSYGGIGGFSSGSSNSAYGDTANPNELGSGGGGDNYVLFTGSCNVDRYYSGGNGGGLIRLNTTSLNLNGTILANGANAQAGGGSGGGIRIDTSTISGTGTISANGGTSTGGFELQSAGGGGGGRIAVYYGTMTLPVANIAVNGGTGNPFGGEGTLYLLPKFDTTPPAVDSVTPASGSIDVPLETSVVVRFNDMINPASVTAGMITLISGGTSVPGSFSYSSDKTTLTFKPDNILGAGRIYTFTLKAGVRDFAGNATSNDLVVVFTTVKASMLLENLGSLSSPHVLASGSYSTLTIRNSYVVLDGVLEANTINATSNSYVVLSGAVTADTVNVTSNSTLTQKSTGPSGMEYFDLTVTGTMFVDATSKIDVSSCGYLGAWQQGNNTRTGMTFGNTTMGGSGSTSGGSYGGYGGYWGAGGVNAVYGDPTNPNELGSGGGSDGGSSPAGNGGGLVRLKVGILQLDGSIVADGQLSNYVGGGSGGGIRLDVDTLSGSGWIYARGGASSYGRGGGGGGRIAIYYGAMTLPVANVLATGGSGNPSGGAGTVYLKNKVSLNGDMAIVGSGNRDTQTVLSAGTYGSITVTNATMITDGPVHATTMVLNNAFVQATVITAANVSLTSSSVLTHPNATNNSVSYLDLTISGTLSVDATSKIDVSSCGYLGAWQQGNNTRTGMTFGNTTMGGSGSTSGGSYGGYGGYWGAGGVNAVYGDPTNPNELGSGGGSDGGSSPAGNGGGLVRLKVGILQLDGSIVADGQLSNYVGGGSGGGIRLDVDTLSGSGWIYARGGASSYGRGGGGGGRIAIYYGAMTLPVANVLATGGSGNPSGGAGTVYLKNKVSLNGDMAIVGSGNRDTQTVLSAGTYGSITVTNATMITDGPVHATTMVLNNAFVQATVITAANVSLTSSSVLTHPNATNNSVSYLDLTISGTLSVDATSKIDVSGRGYLGGYQGGNNTRTGITLGNITTGGSSNNSGGSYGGYGGRWGSDGVVNAVYGDLTNPNELGSGGGGYGDSYALVGDGGGLVRLKAGFLQLDGSIIADGQSSIYAGGGSGGGIRLDVDTLSGSGWIYARGGASSYSGTGGGGRIAIYYGAMTLPTANVLATGGSGNPSGGAGTVYLKSINDSTDQLIIDNRTIDTAEGSTLLRTLGSGVVTQVTADTLTASGANWQPGSLKGMKFAPDVTKSALFTVIDNNATSLRIDPAQGNLTQATAIGLTYAGTYAFTKVSILGKGRLSSLDRFVITDQLIVDGSTFVANSVAADKVSIINGGMMSHWPTTLSQEYNFSLNATTSLIIDAFSKIDVSGRGYLGGWQQGNNTRTGMTFGNTTMGGSGSTSGGSYGGYGGYWGAGGVNAVYGDPTNPNELGSGGGSDGGSSPAGNGGGLVRLKVGILQLDGSIVADGQLSNYVGGGSGGGIRLDVDTLSGSGWIYARGGASSYGRGGGGGGRIAIYYGAMTLPVANVLATGGSGNPSGGAGTVFSTPNAMALTVTKTSTGSGTITSTPSGISCGATCSNQFYTMNTVTLSALPASGSNFTGWSGACTGLGVCTVTMDMAKNVSAAFSLAPPPTVIITAPSGNINNSRPTLLYTVSDGTVVVKVDGVVVNKVSGSALDTLSDGSHLIRVESTNSAGKVGFAETTVVVDTIPPTLSVNSVTTPTRSASLTLAGTVETGAGITITTASGATIGQVSFNSGSWSSLITNLAPGLNTFTVKATDPAGNNNSVNVSTTYIPPLSVSLTAPSMTADHQGTLGITISNITPSGSEVLIEQFIDKNRNGIVDTGDYPIRSFKVSDGIASSNPNLQGDEDGTTNSTIITSLNYLLTNDLYHAPGHYIFRATKGTETATIPFVVDPVSYVQTISGNISDGINPIPGALVRLLDKWQRPVAWAIADGIGAYVLNVKQPGDYFLLPIAYGYGAPATPVTIAASQNILNQTLQLTAGTYHVSGRVLDSVSSAGIGGVWVQAKGTIVTAEAITGTDGSYDLVLPSGQYGISALADTSVPGVFAKGYVDFNNHPLNITVNGNVAGNDIALTNGAIRVSGRVLDQNGNPVQGLPVEGKIRGAIDVREPVSFTISDAAGNYSLGLFTGTNWDIFIDNMATQSLGYLGTITHDLSTAVGPLTGNNLTVHPVTAWIQGTVKDSTNKVLAGIEVQLHNADSSITASVVTAADGTYRLGAFAGTWLIDALTTAKGLPAVPGQNVSLVDSQITTNDFIVDVTPPLVTITSPSAGITNNPRPVLTYTVSDGTVVVKVDGAIVSKISGNSLDLLSNGQHTVRIESTDASGNLGYGEVTFTVNYTPPTVSTASLPFGIVGSAYNQLLMASGGLTPYTWSITSGTLPAGLSLSPASGVISGNPTTVATSNFTVTATDANNATASKALSITVYAALSVTTASLADVYVGSSYNQTLAATGGKTPYTWSITAGTLPVGLSLNTSTGAITGTPTIAGASTITVKVTDANTVTASKDLTITVYAVPAVSTTSLPAGYLSTAYTQTLAVTGGKSPFTWSINSGTLPAGLSLNTSTGAITGTPTTTGTSTITFKVKDTNNISSAASSSITITVYAALSVTTASLPDAYIGSAYSQTLAATGGKTPYTWSITAGTLPTGLTLNASTGAITGTPTTAAAPSSITFKVTDANTVSTTKSISIAAYAVPVVSTASLPDGYLTTAYNQTLAVTGGKSPYTWSITTGTLPTGLSLNTATGAITGTPTATGSKTMTFQAKDTNNITASKSLTITVYALPSISTTSLANGTIGTAYSQTLAATGGKTAYTWSITSGTLPAGLSLNTSTGAITGTPTTAGTSSITFQVADANNKTATKALSITIVAPPVAQLNAWTNLSSAAPNNTSGTLAAGSFTVSSGYNRLLLVSVIMEIGTAANPTISATYGGTALTQLKITNNTQKEIVWVGYLKESQIGSGSKALSITYSGATGNATGVHVNWAAFSGVNQTTPAVSSGGTNTATTSATFGSTINYVANGMTTVVAGNGGTPATGALTATPAFTAGTAITSNGQTSRTFTTTLAHTAAGSYASTTPVTWTGTTSAWSGLVVVSLQP